MIVINGKEINTYADYSKLTGEDMLAFMKTKPAEDLKEFKAFLATPKTVTAEDGTVTEHRPSFFEIRNWILDKYAPGIREKKPREVEETLIDKFMNL